MMLRELTIDYVGVVSYRDSQPTPCDISAFHWQNIANLGSTVIS